MHDIQSLCMQFVADALLIRASRSDDKEKWLLTGIAGAFGEDIVQLSVRLGVYLIKHQARYVQTVFGTCFCGKHLVKPGIAVVDNTFGGGGDF